MRLLFNLLSKIKSRVTPSSVFYRMKDAEYNSFLLLLEKQGFIQSKNDKRSYSNNTFEVTSKGLDFLEEHKHFEFEMPVDDEDLPHWIRFEGKVYKPRSKEGMSAVIDHGTVGQLDYKQWTIDMEIAITASLQRNGRGLLDVDAQASEEEIATVEAQLGLALPESFRHVLLGYARRVHFFWHVPESEACLESGLKIQSGGFLDDGLWDLDKLVDYNTMRNDLDYLDDEYKQHWAFSLVFARDGMGSYYAIDLKYNVGEVIFLSNEGHYHGWRLARDFESFFDNWMRIGCAGAYVEDLIAFSTYESPYVSKNSTGSKMLTTWLTTY